MEDWDNFITLLDATDSDFIPADRIPHPPDVKRMVAQDGDLTWDIPENIKFGDGQRVIPFQREAKPGELLRDVEMRFIPDIRENIEFRAKVRAACEGNIQAQQFQKLLCKNSIVYFCNTWCWTFHPGKEAQPFIAFDIQKSILKWFVWCVKLRLSSLLEKSREGGASWLMMIGLTWLALFYPRYFGYVLSMTEGEVDDRTEDSLMGKIRYLFYYMPEWMLGGWTEKSSDIDVKMAIKVPATNANIKGKLSGGKAGRGGRANIAVFDEFAHVEDAPDVLDASSSLAFSKIFVSTVRGMNNAFAKIRFSPGAILFRFNGKNGFHWSNHLYKDEKWAIRERAKPEYTDERWAQEQEIQYETSTSGRVYPRLKSFVSNENEWCHFNTGNYAEYDPKYPVIVGMDYGISDPNAVLFCQLKPEHGNWLNTTHGNCLVVFAEMQKRNQSIVELCEYLLSMPYTYKHFIGDLRTAQQRDRITKMTIIDYMRKNGINIVGKRNTAKAPIVEVQRRIEVPGCFLVNRNSCPKLMEALQQWSYPIDKETGMPKAGSLPLDNQYSHLNKALAYVCDYLFGSDRYDLDTDSGVTWDFNMMHKSVRGQKTKVVNPRDFMTR